MKVSEILEHAYVRQLYADKVRLPNIAGNRHFLTRILRDHDDMAADLAGARADVRNALAAVAELGAQLTQALDQARLAGPPHPPTAEAAGQTRPLTLSAQEALRVALTRPRSELDPYVIHPNECSQAVIEELIDHDLVMVDDGPRTRPSNVQWWSHGACAELTAAALTLPQEPNT